VRIDGERRFDAPPEQVFALLTDPAFLVSALPGIERWDLRDRDRWTAVMRPPVPLSPRLKLDFTVLDRREPEHALVRVNGGAFGSGAVVESDFDLAPDDGGTRMRWRAGIELSGMPRRPRPILARARREAPGGADARRPGALHRG